MKDICEICRRSAIFHKDRVSKRLICSDCRDKDSSTYEVCSGCGQNRPVQTHNECQEPICPNCNRMDPLKYQACARCGEKKRGAVSKKEGKYQGQFLCPNCREVLAKPT